MTNPPQAEYPSALWQDALVFVAWVVALFAALVLSPFFIAYETIAIVRRAAARRMRRRSGHEVLD